jgi:peptidoglycan/LPS O-acetylase OafA/YrhL
LVNAGLESPIRTSARPAVVAERAPYFPSLNALRFVAAAAVLVHHLEQFKSIAQIPNIWGNLWIVALGRHAVEFFFVLSGFLITYLLLAERTKTGTVNIRAFYLRRIFRIWPLYYLILAIGFVLNPILFAAAPAGWQCTLLYLVFLPNVAMCIFPPIPNIAHTWSIGNEEQFYAIWPWLMKSRLNLLALMVGLIALKIWAGSIVHDGPLHIFLDYMFKIEAMAIGGIAAYLLYFNKLVKQVISNPVASVIALVGIASLFTVAFAGSELLLYGSFALLIAGISANDESTGRGAWRIPNYLGNISYGIYMFHPISISLVLLLFSRLGLASASAGIQNAFLYLSAFALTIGLSSLSYHAFESKFLKLKDKFSPLKRRLANAV